MKAYIQTNLKGEIYHVSAFVANDGFNLLGWETFKFSDSDEISDPDPEIVVVGGIGNVRKRLLNLGIPYQGQFDYPEALTPYFGRKIWTSTIGAIFNQEQKWNIFIKPKSHTKKFTGKVVSTFKDFIGIMDNPEEEIWCSELVQFVTEWRCFIRYGQILDIRYYKGAWDSKLNLAVVQEAVAVFSKANAPAAYSLDFGLDKNGRMLLVEANDGHSIGNYGMESINYAKFLSARWAELTNTTDYANF